MSSNLELIQQEIPENAIRACAAAMSVAIAVTDEELVTARRGMFGFGKKVKRYPLENLANVTLTQNPHADLLALDFSNGEDLFLMFKPESRTGAERIVKLLRSRMSRNAGQP